MRKRNCRVEIYFTKDELEPDQEGSQVRPVP